MKIFLVRHGDAGSKIEDDRELDEQRSLTEEGENEIRATARWCQENDEVPNAIFSGPSLRVRQSAKILAEAFGLPTPKVEDGLGGTSGRGGFGAMGSIVRKFAADKDKSRVMMVTHHDTITKGLAQLNGLEVEELETFAKGELRIYKVDRPTGVWEEKERVLPSSLGLEDLYGDTE